MWESCIDDSLLFTVTNCVEQSHMFDMLRLFTDLYYTFGIHMKLS